MDQLEGGTISFPHSYDITRARGRVGYATLYEGTRDPFDKPVWIHVFDLTEIEDIDLELRLERSAERTSKIAVTGALRAVDFGEVDEAVPFIITERVQGPTLASVLRAEGALPPEEVCALIERLASILEPCHEAGFAHGAVHPEFVYLVDSDPANAHLGHFEIGWTLQEMRAEPGGLTRADALGVMSPERFSAPDAPYNPNISPFGPEDDLWALAALAYQCLGGEAPYFDEATDISEALLQVSRHAPRQLRELGVREDIAAVVMQAMSRTPGARPDSAQAFAQSLKDILAPEPKPTPEPAKPAPAPVAEAPSPRKEPVREEESFDQDWETNRTGTIAGVAILLVIVTNLFWVIQLVSQSPWLPNLQPSPALEIKTDPPGAKLLITPEGQEPTPRLSPYRLDTPSGQNVEVRVQKNGQKDTLMRVKRRDDVQDVTIVLEATQ